MKMKAIVMHKPRDLRFEDVDIPEPLPDEVLIKVKAVGICGSDIPRINIYGAHKLPIIPGHEFAGEIVEANGDMGQLKAGDRVTIAPLIPCYQCQYCKMGEYSLCEDYSYYGSRCNGAFAQFVAVKKCNLLRVSENITDAFAATTDPLANALHGLKQGGMKTGKKVCVYGVGPIGLYTIQAARLMGAAEVVAVDISKDKLDIAIKCGVDKVFDGRDSEVASQIYDYFKGGADLVLDITGSPIAQLNAILSTAKLGCMVLLGISHKELKLSKLAVDRIMRGQISIKGSWNSFSDPFPGWEWTYALKLMETGKLEYKSIITHELALSEAPSLFEKIHQGDLFYNKVLFYPWLS